MAFPGRRSIFYAFFAFLFILSAHHSVRAETPDNLRIIHVYVTLADNINQRIVPVPAKLGNGNDAGNNLYWGALYGVKTFFRKSDDWTLLKTVKKPARHVLERVIFKHKDSNTYLIADAYEGNSIKHTIKNFLFAVSGRNMAGDSIPSGTNHPELSIAGQADLVVYIGHNGLMDFSLASYPENNNKKSKDVIILACASKPYFIRAVRQSGANPLLWTTNLMAPEAYTLKAALDGWILKETPEQVRERAAASYHKYQKCGLSAARRLLVTGW